jgi:cation transport regulator ChaC
MEKFELKFRLKATLEASKIYRMGEDIMYNKLNSFENELKQTKIKDSRREYLEELVGVLNQKIERNIDTRANTAE